MIEASGQAGRCSEERGLRVDFVTFTEPWPVVLCALFLVLVSWQSEYASSSARGF